MKNKVKDKICKSDVCDAIQFALNRDVAPNENFRLLYWCLDFPMNFNEELTAIREALSEHELEGGFERPIYFHTNSEGELMLRIPVISVPTLKILHLREENVARR